MLRKNVAKLLCVASGQSYGYRGSALSDGCLHFVITWFCECEPFQDNYSVFYPTALDSCLAPGYYNSSASVNYGVVGILVM